MAKDEKNHYSPDVSEISEAPEVNDSTFVTMTPENTEKGRMAYV